MCPYDFESYHDRKHTKASKWVKMLQLKPDVKEGIVPMTVADMDFMNAPEIGEAIAKYAKTEILGYSRPTDQYLDSILRYYEEKHGYKGKREWIYTTPGVVPALAAAVRACTKPHEGVVIFSPVYGPFYEVVEGQGREMLLCPLSIVNGRYEINFEHFESLAAREDAKLLLFCSPHNPSGRVWTREELVKVAKIAHRHGLRVCCDEIHSDIIVGSIPHTVFNTVCEEAEDAILCTSAGKTYNIQALQCANIFIKDPQLYHEFEETNLFTGLERANILGMIATQAAYERCGNWAKEATEVIKRNHAITEAFFERYAPRLTAMKADASFLCFVDYAGMKVPREEFLSFLVECDFYVTDGAFFGKDTESFIRINVGLPTKALKENLARLEKGLKERYGI